MAALASAVVAATGADAAAVAAAAALAAAAAAALAVTGAAMVVASGRMVVAAADVAVPTSMLRTPAPSPAWPEWFTAVGQVQGLRLVGPASHPWAERWPSSGQPTMSTEGSFVVR